MTRQPEPTAHRYGTVFDAIHRGEPDPQLLSYQYLQMLPQLAQGDANKVFVIPSEFSQAVAGIGRAFNVTAPAPEGGVPASPADETHKD